jgi:hypothetical protein
MTNKEKEAIVKAAFPGIDEMSLSIAMNWVQDGDTITKYKTRNPMPPEVLMGTVFTAKDALKAGQTVVKGGQAAIKGGSVAFKYIKSALPGGKTAAKAAEEAASGKKKIVTKKRVAGVAGLSAAVGTYNMIESGKGTEIDPNASAAEIAAQDSFAQAIANADAQGVDVTQFLSGTTAQQLGLGANNISDFMSARGYVNPLTGLNGIGIFTGKETPTSTPRRKFGGTITGSKSEIVSLSEWNKSFPVDAAGISVC